MANLISPQEVKEITNITRNVDESKFCYAIEVAQDIHLRQMIGRTCYENLINATPPYTGDNDLVWNGDGKTNKGAKYALAWWVVYESFEDLAITVTPTGVQKKSGSDYESVSDQALQALKKRALARAESYTDQVICYLQDNSIACYCDDNDCCTDKLSSGYNSSGISLDDEEDRILSEFDRINGNGN